MTPHSHNRKSSIKTGFGLVLALAVFGFGNSALADPKPSPSKAVSAQIVANKYAGRMQVWKSCKGGAYFGPNFEVVAYCGQNKKSVGVGTWTTKGGKICYQLTWHFIKDGQQMANKKDPKCEVAMVSDADGQVWHSWSSDSEWWRGFPQEKNFSKGNKYKRQVAKLRKQYGI